VTAETADGVARRPARRHPVRRRRSQAKVSRPAARLRRRRAAPPRWSDRPARQAEPGGRRPHGPTRERRSGLPRRCGG